MTWSSSNHWLFHILWWVQMSKHTVDAVLYARWNISHIIWPISYWFKLIINHENWGTKPFLEYFFESSSWFCRCSVPLIIVDSAMVILILGPFKLHINYMIWYIICIDNDENSRPTPSPHEMVSNKIKIINFIIVVALKKTFG